MTATKQQHPIDVHLSQSKTHYPPLTALQKPYQRMQYSPYSTKADARKDSSPDLPQRLQAPPDLPQRL
jgi:hypothetical protein